ncbi:hypothetical protein LSH36_1308g00011 [Paralvinella palmiformis]|uniref:Uncharacterized protein n=1 Tax=Paralvinella palmiformis TaxID=53620 RepID=A0AAD9IUY3_9ANNE|nr:hypothetical protein LSH36_1308g00011 [Paralvinella palmiformis]
MCQKGELTSTEKSVSMVMGETERTKLIEPILSPVMVQTQETNIEQKVLQMMVQTQEPTATVQTASQVIDQTQKTTLKEHMTGQTQWLNLVEQDEAQVMAQTQELTVMKQMSSPMMAPTQERTLLEHKTSDLMDQTQQLTATEQTASPVMEQIEQATVDEQTSSLRMDEKHQPNLVEQTSSLIIDQHQPTSVYTSSSEVHHVLSEVDYDEAVGQSLSEDSTQQNLLSDAFTATSHNMTFDDQDRVIQPVVVSGSLSVMSPDRVQHHTISDEIDFCVSVDIARHTEGDSRDFADVSQHFADQRLSHDVATDADKSIGHPVAADPNKGITAEDTICSIQGHTIQPDVSDDPYTDTGHSLLDDKQLTVDQLGVQDSLVRVEISEIPNVEETVMTQSEMVQQLTTNVSSQRQTDPDDLSSQFVVITDAASTDTSHHLDWSLVSSSSGDNVHLSAGSDLILATTDGIQTITGIDSQSDIVKGSPDQKVLMIGISLSRDDTLIGQSTKIDSDNVEMQIPSDSVFMNVYEDKEEEQISTAVMRRTGSYEAAVMRRTGSYEAAVIDNDSQIDQLMATSDQNVETVNGVMHYDDDDDDVFERYDSQIQKAAGEMFENELGTMSNPNLDNVHTTDIDSERPNQVVRSDISVIKQCTGHDISKEKLDHGSTEVGQGSHPVTSSDVNNHDIPEGTNQAKDPMINRELIHTSVVERPVRIDSHSAECLQRLMESQSGVTNLSVKLHSVQMSCAQDKDNNLAAVKTNTRTDSGESDEEDIDNLMDIKGLNRREKPASDFGTMPKKSDQLVAGITEAEYIERESYMFSSTQNRRAESLAEPYQSVRLSSEHPLDNRRLIGDHQEQLCDDNDDKHLLTSDNDDYNRSLSLETVQSSGLLTTTYDGSPLVEEDAIRDDINVRDNQPEYKLSKQSSIVCETTDYSRLLFDEARYSSSGDASLTCQNSGLLDNRDIEVSQNVTATTESLTKDISDHHSSGDRIVINVKAVIGSDDGANVGLTEDGLESEDEQRRSVCDDNISVHFISESMDADFEISTDASQQTSATCAAQIDDRSGLEDPGDSISDDADINQLDSVDQEKMNVLKRLHDEEADNAGASAADNEMNPQAAKHSKLDSTESAIESQDQSLDGAAASHGYDGSPVDTFLIPSNDVNVNNSYASLDEGYVTMLHNSLVSPERQDISISQSSVHSNLSQLREQDESASFSDDGSSVDPVHIVMATAVSPREAAGVSTERISTELRGNNKNWKENYVNEGQCGDAGGNHGDGERVNDEDIVDEYPGLVAMASTTPDTGDPDDPDDRMIADLSETDTNKDNNYDEEDKSADVNIGESRNPDTAASVEKEHSKDLEQISMSEDVPELYEQQEQPRDTASNVHGELIISPLSLQTEPDFEMGDDSSDSTNSDLDLGEYRLVHFKSPEPTGRKLDERRSLLVADLSPSDFIEMSNVVELATAASVSENGFVMILGSEERLSGIRNQNKMESCMTGPRTSTPDIVNMEDVKSEETFQDASYETEDDTIVIETSSLMTRTDDEEDTITDEIIVTDHIEHDIQNEHDVGHISPGSSVDPIICITPDGLDNDQERLEVRQTLFVDTHHSIHPSSGAVSDSGLDTDWTPTDTEVVFSPVTRTKNTPEKVVTKQGTPEIKNSKELTDKINSGDQSRLSSPSVDVMAQSRDVNSQMITAQGASLRTEKGEGLETHLVRENDSLIYKISPGGDGAAKSEVQSRLASGTDSSDKQNDLTIEVFNQDPDKSEMALELMSPTEKKVRFVDTQTFVMDIKPQDVTDQTEDEHQDDHEIIFGSQSTVGYSDRRNGVRIAEDYQVFGIQPGGTTKLSYIPGPVQVLRDEPSCPLQSHLQHQSINIEIKPRGRTRSLEDLEYLAGEFLPLEGRSAANVMIGQTTSSTRPYQGVTIDADPEVKDADGHRISETSQISQHEMASEDGMILQTISEDTPITYDIETHEHQTTNTKTETSGYQNTRNQVMSGTSSTDGDRNSLLDQEPDISQSANRETDDVINWPTSGDNKCQQEDGSVTKTCDKFDTNLKKQSVNTKLTGAVETQLSGAVDTQLSGATVGTQLSGAVDTQLSDAVDAELSGAIDTHLTDVVGTQVSDVVETQLSGAVDAQLSGAVDTQLSSAVGTQLSGAVDSQLSGAMDTHLSDAVGTQVSGAVETQLSDAMDSQLSDAVDSQLSDVVDTQKSGAVDTQLSGSVETQLSGVVDTQLSGAVNTQLGGAVGTQLGGAVESQLSGAVNIQLSGGMDSQLSGAVDTQLSGAVETQLGDTAEGKTPTLNQTEVEMFVLNETSEINKTLENALFEEKQSKINIETGISERGETDISNSHQTSEDHHPRHDDKDTVTGSMLDDVSHLHESPISDDYNNEDDLSEGEVEDGLDVSMDSAASTDDGLDSAQRMRDIMEQERKAIMGMVSSTDELDEMNISSNSSSIDENEWRDRALAKVWTEKPKMTASEAFKLAELAHRGKEELDNDKEEWMMRAARAVQAHRVHHLQRQLSPGEIIIPEGLLSELEPLSNSCEAFAQIADQVDQLPELISHDVHNIRERFLRRPVELQRSLSTSELDYVEIWERHQNISCQSSSDTNVLSLEYGDRVPSMDSFIYVFLSRARSLDHMTFQDDDDQQERKGGISRPKSVPLCHRENERMEADQFDLPVREISASLEYLPLPKLTTKQKSSSLGYSGENAHLIDIPPDRIFGGAPDEHAIARESLANSPGYRSRLREVQTQTDDIPPNQQSTQNMGKCVSFGDVMILTDFSFDSEVKSSGSEPTIGGNRSHSRSRIRSPRIYGVEMAIQTSFEDVGTNVVSVRSEAETQTSIIANPDTVDTSVLIQQALTTVRQSVESQTPDPHSSDIAVETVTTERCDITALSQASGITDSSSISSDVTSVSSSPESMDTTLLNSIRKAKEILEAAARCRGSGHRSRRIRYHSDDSSSTSEERMTKRRRYHSGEKYHRDQCTFISSDAFTQTGDSLTNLYRGSSEPNLTSVTTNRPSPSDIIPVVSVEEKPVRCLERWSSEYSVFSNNTMENTKSQSEMNLRMRAENGTVSDFLNRSIETQTYPERRIIETQTPEGGLFEIQTVVHSPQESVTRPIMVDTAVGASPPQCSPILLSPFYDVEGLTFTQAPSYNLSPANENNLAISIQTEGHQLDIDEDPCFEIDERLVNISNIITDGLDERRVSLHHPDLQRLKEEHEKFMETLRKAKESRDKSLEKRKQLKVSRVRAVCDVSEIHIENKQNLQDLVHDDDMEPVRVLSKQNELTGDKEKQTETKEALFLEQSSIILSETMTERQDETSLGSISPESSISMEDDSLVDTIKDINDVLSSPVNISQVSNEEMVISRSTITTSTHKDEDELVSAGTLEEDEDFDVITNTEERCAGTGTGDDVHEDYSTQTSQEIPTDVVHQQNIVGANVSDVARIEPAGDECSLVVTVSEDRDTASESSGHTTGSEVTVIEATLEESGLHPEIFLDDEHPGSELEEGGAVIKGDNVMVSSEVPIFLEQTLSKVTDLSGTDENAFEPGPDNVSTVSVRASGSVSIAPDSESVTDAASLLIEDVSVISDSRPQDVTVSTSPQFITECSISPVISRDMQQMFSPSQDTEVILGRSSASPSTVSSKQTHEGPSSKAAATQYDDKICSLSEDNNQTHITTTHYKSTINDGIQTRTRQLVPVSEDHFSQRTTNQDSDIQVIVEKYQKIKDLIEKGAINEIEGIPVATSPNTEMMTSTPNLRGAPDVQIHVSVATHLPGDTMERSQSAPPTPARASISTSTMADSLLSPTSTMIDEAVETESVNTEYDDELERLRKERERIMNMLAKDQMPSKLQVELAEAQLNYLIGQTDTLLTALDEPLWDTSSIMALSAPEEQLSEISKRYLAGYRETLQRSRLEIENRIFQLEKEQQDKYRSRQRSRQYVRMKRNIEKEAFLMERQREQVRYQTVINLPFSKSVSPSRSHILLRTTSPESQSMPPSVPLKADFLKPKQRVSYLAEKRRHLVQSTQTADLERSRSMSPAFSVGSSSSAISSRSYSTGMTHPYSYLSSIPGQQQVEETPHSSNIDDILKRYDNKRRSEDFLCPTPESFDVASITSSLDEESYQLLVDYQSARGRTKAEIEMAKEYLNRRPASKRMSRSPSSIHNVSPGFMTSASQFESLMDSDLEREIDREIEELKVRYSKLSAEVRGDRPEMTPSIYPRNTSIRQVAITSTPQMSSLYDPHQSSFSERDLLLMTGRHLPYNHGIHDSLQRYDVGTPLTNTTGYTSVFKKTRPVNATDIKAQILRERKFAISHNKHNV